MNGQRPICIDSSEVRSGETEKFLDRNLCEFWDAGADFGWKNGDRWGASGHRAVPADGYPLAVSLFVLSILLTSSLLGSSLAVLRPLGRLFGMPDGAESLLIPAFLGGYPVGAQNVAAAFRSGQLTKPEAERLLSFAATRGLRSCSAWRRPCSPAGGWRGRCGASTSWARCLRRY